MFAGFAQIKTIIWQKVSSESFVRTPLLMFQLAKFIRNAEVANSPIVKLMRVHLKWKWEFRTELLSFIFNLPQNWCHCPSNKCDFFPRKFHIWVFYHFFCAKKFSTQKEDGCSNLLGGENKSWKFSQNWNFQFMKCIGWIHNM